MSKGMSIEIMQAEIKKTDGDGESLLYPQVYLVESIVKPGWTMPGAPTLEAVIDMALVKAKKADWGTGKIFIQDSGPNQGAYRANGPWNFSAETYQRHGLVKKD